MTELYALLEKAEKSNNSAAKKIASHIRTDIGLYESYSKVISTNNVDDSREFIRNPFMGYDRAIIDNKNGYTHRMNDNGKHVLAMFDNKIRLLHSINNSSNLLEIILGE